MIVILKSLPTWVRRNLRNLAHGGSGLRSLDSQNQPESWWDPGFQNTSGKASFLLLSSIELLQKKKKLLAKEGCLCHATNHFLECSEWKSRGPRVGVQRQAGCRFLRRGLRQGVRQAWCPTDAADTAAFWNRRPEFLHWQPSKTNCDYKDKEDGFSASLPVRLFQLSPLLTVLQDLPTWSPPLLIIRQMCSEELFPTSHQRGDITLRPIFWILAMTIHGSGANWIMLMTGRLLGWGLGQTNLSHESLKTDSVLLEFLNPILVQTCLASSAREFSSWQTALLPPWVLALWIPPGFSLPLPLVPFSTEPKLQGCRPGSGWQGEVRASSRGPAHAMVLPAPPWSGMMTDGHRDLRLSVTLRQPTGPTKPAYDWSHDDTGTSRGPSRPQGPFSLLSPMSLKERL